MRCPVCNHPDTRVVDSRMSAEGDSIRRRRECDKCGFRFSTSEEILLLDLVVVKRDGQREAYSKEKLIGGLKKALEKRPVTEAAFRSLVHGIERAIQRLSADEITSVRLGEIVMQHLKDFDEVAYIRFASVYRQFEDVETFQRELDALMRLSVVEAASSRKRKKRL
ncbi:transcriptional regulator NrdR [Patescibacteria group bacterium]|uniref:Transcriptional repressor NrdR n=1 Tax=candidate division WWE3 bacterium TaxID=2053526 RepID=A0A928Y5S7_UNCKA|nr:transcriptional repressor NrdR [candidate division WWE3 bacterium]MCL4732404.1 transcriptional regulator NrdR [Patescibacteria group bacterium]MDL1952830.1 transcriptional repressor NrdR [Candidatus Uhrbacteria bacterium UHB]RIL01066.1 MAG: transcriptional regulator NrdR [Candidatus Uhrbacteria bacterium]